MHACYGESAMGEQWAARHVIGEDYGLAACFADSNDMAASDIMLIDRGDLASLVALGLETMPRGLVIWHPVETWGPHESRRLVAERHAEVFGAQELLIADMAEAGLQPHAEQSGPRQGLLLLTALSLAQDLGCAKLVWPVHGGNDPERIGRSVALAQLASEMAETDHDGSAVAVSLPVVDLSDEQLVDLADDLSVPIQDFWPCERTAEHPCGSCPECVRWMGAFEQLGLPWPWSRLAVATRAPARNLAPR